MMGVSLRAYARMRGCSLDRRAEGDRQQAHHDAPGRDHRSRARQPGVGEEHVRRADAPRRTPAPLPRCCLDANRVRSAADPPFQPASGMTSDPVAAYLRARAVNETFKAKISQLEYEERSRKLIPAARASEYAATFSAIVKDALLSMPDRLAPMLAAVDDEKAIHRMLAGRSHGGAQEGEQGRCGFGSLTMQPFSMHEVGAAAVLPPREITVSQWADENRVLTGGAAAERGQWRTRPYQREPMDVLSPAIPAGRWCCGRRRRC